MVTLLLFIIYIAFIGLGLPDSLLGSAWTVMHLDIGASTEFAGVVAFTVSMCTVVSSLMASRFLHRFGTGVVTGVSVLLTAIAVVGYSVTTVPWFLILCAVPLGLGAGAVDAALSNFVALHYEAKHMNWLHCCWGIGATAGPLVMSFSLKQDNNWGMGFRMIGILLFVVAIVIGVSIPLWKKLEKGNAGKKSDSEELQSLDAETKQPADAGANQPADAKVNQAVDAEVSQAVEIRNKDAVRIAGVKETMLSMFCYNGTETAVGLWIATYFVATKGFSPAAAAGYCSLFYIGIIVGRFLAGVISMHVSGKWLIRIGSIIGCAGLLIMLLPLPGYAAVAGLLIMGLGGAPIYPNIVHTTPKKFGTQASATVIGLEMASAYVGSTTLPLLTGLLAGAMGLYVIPAFFLVMFLLMFAASERANQLTTNRGPSKG